MKQSRKIDFTFEIFPSVDEKLIIVKAGPSPHEVLYGTPDLSISSVLQSPGYRFHHLPMCKIADPTSFIVCLYNPQNHAIANRLYCHREQLISLDLRSTSYIERYFAVGDHVITYHGSSIPTLNFYKFNTSEDPIWSEKLSSKVFWDSRIDINNDVFVATEGGLYKLEGQSGKLIWSAERNLAPSNGISAVSLNTIGRCIYMSLFQSEDGIRSLRTTVYDITSGKTSALEPLSLDYPYWFPISFHVSPLYFNGSLWWLAPSSSGTNLLRLNSNDRKWTIIGSSTIRRPRRFFVIDDDCIILVGTSDCPRVEMIIPSEESTHSLFASREVSNFDCVPMGNTYLGLYTQQRGSSILRIIKLRDT